MYKIVSVKRCTLNSEYIEAAHKLIIVLEDKYNIEYAYFYLRYDEDQEWYDGDWILYIASNDINHYQEGTRIILDTMKLLNIDLPEFYFEICSPSIEDYTWQQFNKIVIKEYSL